MNMLRMTGVANNAALDFLSRYGDGERRRVLMTLDAVGGVWRYAVELARGLRPHGVEVVFAGLGPKPSREKVEEIKPLGDVVWLDAPLDWMARDEGALAQIPSTLARLAEEEGADLLHLNLPTQAAGLDTRRPVVAVSHSCMVTWWNAVHGTSLPGEWDWIKRLNTAGMARADAVVSPSGSYAQALVRCYGEQPLLHVVHNGISAFLQGGEKEHFVFGAGRWWDEGKNARALDRAAAKISWPIILAGADVSPSGQKTRLSRVRLLGEIPHRKVLAQVRQAAIVVSPSLYEPFGLAALEGARAGAALVLSDIPTYRELWSEAALFFDPHDPDSLAEAVNRLVKDESLRLEMGARALARSRRFTPDVQARRMAELYRDLTDAPVARA
ncbi:glycosyltransferase family 4 protein [Nitratireductor sp. GCM10026969]|uniref:glycosyltransferase family 4 protein n=1 Tax=Nitratireductor sp. GCM10026969 TaxID=3252645 RepID=UPI00362242A9